MRSTIIAGNWKMHGTCAEAEALLRDLLPQLPTDDRALVIVCPPYTALATVHRLIQNTRVLLGAQDVFWKERGAYTGCISPLMLLEIGCRYVIIGHSERRGRFGVPEPDFDAPVLAHFGDNNVTVNRKLRAALAHGLVPICCVGETLAERQAGQTDTIVADQVRAALQDVQPEQAARVIFAYEPVWAIGTGEVCQADEANRVCGLVRQTVQQQYGTDVAAAVHVQYGGSVKPDNARELLAQPEIDGALVGGASLKAADFAAIVAAAPVS
ncbi:MAG: triose-phosphate isomerase [Chloroherpetonaceae bacterium]|nr:triose-phosphate isomerase [Chthonomonadaceae bacterium]MDW8209064.1 triose-phosphate isomerase [Chloroherpetonaceae bacterium]